MKHALIGLTWSPTRGYGPKGVRCNAICPGWLCTEWADVEMAKPVERRGLASIDESYDLVTRDVLPGRPATAMEVADVAAFPCSAEASKVTRGGTHRRWRSNRRRCADARTLICLLLFCSGPFARIRDRGQGERSQRVADQMILASVAARSSSSLTPSAVSTIFSPPSTTSRTPRLVMMRSTTPLPVSGRVHSFRTLVSPFLLV